MCTPLSETVALPKLGFELVVRTGRDAAAPRKIPSDRFIADRGGGGREEFPVESPNKIDYG